MYPFSQMRAEAAELRPPRLNYATYMGLVRVELAGRSRGGGLFTTAAVKGAISYYARRRSHMPSSRTKRVGAWRKTNATVITSPS